MNLRAPVLPGGGSALGDEPPGAALLGAVCLDHHRCRFTVWAPASATVAVAIEGPGGRDHLLQHLGSGYHGAVVEHCPAGTRYRYLLDTGEHLADPVSRHQPAGVHGPSEVVDLTAHRFGDGGFGGRPLPAHVLYEVHIGTFTPEGTFDAAVGRLDDLVALGVTTVEVMPVGQFPGVRNWGYDGVFPFAVQESYGGPWAFQQFVDECHARGLSVALDVVYNHLGPEGNVLGRFGPYLTDRYVTPWGPAVNVDGPSSDPVRRYFIENALMWLRDFHVDMLRLDAVHGIVDPTATPFLSELAASVAELGATVGRPLHLVAESADNNPRVVRSIEAGGFGMDAQWNDDFHHALHVAATGERFGYYADFQGVPALVGAIGSGFVLQGQHSVHRGRRHGAPSTDVDPERLVVYAQNHDQVGNRPTGDRMATMVPAALARLVMVVVTLSPGIPLLFMGEEYGEVAPFPFFVDHGDPALVGAVRDGRAAEMAELGVSGVMADPADPATFRSACLAWDLRRHGEHREMLQLTTTLLALRAGHPALRRAGCGDAAASADGPVLSVLRRAGQQMVVILCNFSASPATTRMPAAVDGGSWEAELLLAAPSPAGAAGPGAAGGGTERRPGPVPLGPYGFEVWAMRSRRMPI